MNTGNSEIRNLRMFVLPQQESSALFCGYAATTPAMSGSWFSVLFFAAGFWGLASQILGRYQVSIPRRSLPFILACAFYALTVCASSVMAPNQERLLPSLLSYAGFLFVSPLIARICLSRPSLSFDALLSFAPLGALLGLAMGLVQIFVMRHPLATGGAGNADVYGLVMTVLGALSLCRALGGNGLRYVIGAAGFFSGCLAVFLSDSRTLFPMIALLPALALAVSPAKKMAAATCLAVALGIAALFASAQYFPNKVEQAYGDLSAAAQASPATSMGARWILWNASAQAIHERPWLGWGAQNKMAAVNSHIDRRESPYLSFRHVHNQLLDALVAGGVLGGIAVICVLLTPLYSVFRRKGEFWERRCAALSILLIYGTSSITGAPFQNDLMLTLFLTVNAVILAADPLKDHIQLSRLRDTSRRASELV